MTLITSKMGKDTIPMEVRPDLQHSYMSIVLYVYLLKTQNFANIVALRSKSLVQILGIPYSQKMITVAAISLNIAGDTCTHEFLVSKAPEFSKPIILGHDFFAIFGLHKPEMTSSQNSVTISIVPYKKVRETTAYKSLPYTEDNIGNKLKDLDRQTKPTQQTNL